MDLTIKNQDLGFNKNTLTKDFCEIKISDKKTIQKYLNVANLGISEHCFTDIYMWQNHYDTKFLVDDDFLYIKSKGGNLDLYMCPVGSGDLKQAISNIMQNNDNNEFIMVSITEEMKEIIEQIMPNQFDFFENRDTADYIYLAENMITLAGKKLHSKRNFINRFFSEYDGRWSYEDLNDTNLNDAWKFHLKWHKETGCIEEDESLRAETCAIKKALDNYKELDIKGGILKVDDEIVAFTLGTKSTNDMFVIQIEKADVNFIGAYPTINQLFAKKNCSDVTYINREEDLGLEGLRKAKESYKPEILKMKYYAKIRRD